MALNAANETAVAAFLEGRIGFADIPAVVQAVMDGHRPAPAGSVEAVFAVDREARRAARHILKQR